MNRAWKQQMLTGFVLLLMTGRGCVAQSFAEKRPLTHEVLWQMKRVGAPVPSPDGRWLVFPVAEPAYSESDEISDLWIMPTDGSTKPRRLTSGKGTEREVDWSHDSRRIAFSAKREGDEKTQIYVLDLAGGEAVRVTSLSSGARSPRWSPDGQALLFQSSVFTGALDEESNRKIAEERKSRKYQARVYEGFPIRYWDHWLDDVQTHILIQKLTENSAPRDLLAETNFVKQPGFAGRMTISGEDLDAEWTPDGASVVFVATLDKHKAAWSSYTTQIYQVPLVGGEPTPLTRGQASHKAPTFSPDGKQLFCLLTPDNSWVYNVTRIAQIPWPGGGHATLLTSNFDRSVDNFTLSGDGKILFLTAEEAGQNKLFTVPSTGGPVKPLLRNPEGSYSGIACPEQETPPTLYGAWESATHPTEVVRIAPSAARHETLTDFNLSAAAEIDWQPVRHFWFTSKAGKSIHNLLVLPAGFDATQKYPLLVLIHGGPFSMWKDGFTIRWNYHLLAGSDYVVLLTNYTGSTGFGERFAQAIQGDPLKGPGLEINEAADEAIRRFAYIDGTRQAAAGASYGGHLVNWLQATTNRFNCLISHAGLINLESQWGTSDGIYHREVMNGGPPWEQNSVWRQQSPIRYAAAFRTPILLTVGENDFRVPLNQTLENWSVLQRLRIPSKLIVFSNENHWIQKGENSRFFYQQVRSWLEKWLQGKQPLPKTE
ncbi:MAG: S9 family peptidase [Acidobacteriota bacterium]